MALAAPAIAALIHSWCVYHSGHRLYNAEIGGIYFHGPEPIDKSVVRIIIINICACGVPAILTFLGLLAVRQNAFYRWCVWSGFIFLWTWLCFKAEIAFQ